MTERKPKVGDIVTPKTFEELIQTKGLKNIRKDVWKRNLHHLIGKALKVTSVREDKYPHPGRDYWGIIFTHGRDSFSERSSDFFKILS